MASNSLIKKIIKNSAKRMGYFIIPEQRMDSYLLEMRLKKIILEYDIDCIIDVGANIGQYYDFLRKNVEYSGLIISFEPDPNNFKELIKRNKVDKKWIISDYALGSERNLLDFNIMKVSAFNSFRDPDNSETNKYDEMNSIVEKIQVETRRLDEIIVDLKKLQEFKNIFLKLDTQGYDLEVFKGASGCLDQIRGVQTEVSVMPIYKDMPNFESSLKAFKSKGFEVSGLYSLSEKRFPHAVEFDCIYLPK